MNNINKTRVIFINFVFLFVFIFAFIFMIMY